MLIFKSFLVYIVIKFWTFSSTIFQFVKLIEKFLVQYIYVLVASIIERVIILIAILIPKEARATGKRQEQRDKRISLILNNGF